LHAGNAEFTERIWSLDSRMYRPDPLNPVDSQAGVDLQS
jgi:hypothetical protein